MAHGSSRRPGRPRRGGGPERGQATVELALALPVVVLALLLVVQVALVARSQVVVVHLAREGARAASVGEPVPHIDAEGTLGEGRVTVVRSGGGSPGEMVTVTVSYDDPTDVALVGELVGSVTVRASVTMRVEGPTG